MSTTFESRVCGIPCLIEVISCVVVKGNSWADNHDDYHGYAEVEFDVLDGRGRPAPWLSRKMSLSDRNDVESEILERHAKH